MILYKRAFVFIPFQIPREISVSNLSCCIAVVLLKELLQLNKASGNENQTELLSLN